MKKFREYHLLKILNESAMHSVPIDAFLRRYFKENKAVGSKDRQEICTTLYEMIRWLGLIDAKCSKPITWEKRLESYRKFPVANLMELPLHVQVSFPKFLFERLKEEYSEQKALDFCFNSNQQAPTTIRVNSLKTTRQALLKKWKGVFDVFPCKHSDWGIVFNKRVNFFALPEFKAGLFEVQDEGSQLVAKYVQAASGDHILDYCAGSGGKSLAFAPLMKHHGQIYLYDIRPRTLLEARKRLKRAGIQNAQLLDKKKLKKPALLNRMDWILLDVPCTGTGTLRRNPDMKWKLTPDTFTRLVEEQRKIFEEALKFLHPNGKIVYATCSVFPEENEKQISYFIKTYGLKLVGTPFQSFPKQGEMDGFFCATLAKI